jgi:hypothetical protein
MVSIMSFRLPSARLFMPVVLALPMLLPAQDTPPPPAQSSSSKSPKAPPFPDGPLRLKWITLGFRVPYNIEKEIPGGTVDASTSVTARTITTTGQGSHVAPGAVLEAPVFGRLTFVLEGSWHRASYTQTRTDSDIIASGTIATTFTENTKASEFDFPAMLRYTGFGSSRIFSKVYVAAGASYRVVTGINTANTIVFTSPSSTNTSTNTIPAKPNESHVLGEVVGIGYRFLDDFNIRVTPEIRFTHWMGRPFDSFSTRSAQNQLEVGVALTF